MKDELISVIVPVYNVEKYLERCVNSILNQTYKNLEIILIDDGSTDNSGKICDEFKEKDERIKIIHKGNLGVSDARNTGINIANGEFISFIDSDDFIKEDFYEFLMTLQKKFNADITECGYILAYEHDIDSFEFPIRKDSTEMVTDGFGATYLLLADDDDIGTNEVVVWNKLYKKEIWSDISFPINKRHEDQFVMYDIFAKCQKFVTSTEIKYAYFQRNDSFMNKKFETDRFDTFEAFEKFIDYCNKNNYVDFKGRILRVYLKTLVNFIPLLSYSKNEEEFKENKERLEEIFYQKYNYIMKFIQNEPLLKNRGYIYERFKKKFEQEILLVKML